MRALVTGGCGFIGGHLVDLLLRGGHQVLVIDSVTYAGHMGNLPPGFRGFRFGDVADYTLMLHHMREFRPDWVLHAAAETHVGRAIDRADEFLLANVVGTHAVLEACLAYWQGSNSAAFRLLHVSTDEVHGSLGPGEAPWTEASQYAPNNQYAAAKAGADHLCRAYVATQGLPVIVTHCGNNYGTRQHPEKLLPTLIGQRQAGLPMTLHGDGQNVRDWIAVEDHCAGLLAACARGTPGATYALSAGETLRNVDIADLIARLLPGPYPGVEFVADRPGNDRRYQMDCTQTRQALGWAPQYMLQDRLPSIVDWHASAPDFAAGYGRCINRRTFG